MPRRGAECSLMNPQIQVLDLDLGIPIIINPGHIEKGRL